MSIRSDTLANLSLTIMCLVVAYAVLDRYIVAKAALAPPNSGYKAGDLLTTSADDIGLKTARLSAVVAVSNSCHFCAESAPFYQQLIALQQRYTNKVFQTVFLGMTGREDAAAFAKSHNLGLPAIKGVPLDVMPNIPGTPTLLLVDANGRVASSWVGKLSPSDERAVLSAITARLRQF